MSKSFFFFGFGTDGKSPIHDDQGHVRITRMEHGTVTGGKKETHDRTVEACIEVNKAVTAVHRKHGDNPDPRYFRDAVRSAIEPFVEE